jgi:hypothetical protein
LPSWRPRSPNKASRAMVQRPISSNAVLRSALTPNPSLKRSANGRPPSPAWWYAVHFHQSGLGGLPSSPA